MSVERWLGNLRPSTARVNKRYFERWMKWLHENGGKFAGFTPNELIAYQRKHRDYEVLDVVQPWVRSVNGRASYKRKLYSAIRSFFRHNRAELPRDDAFTVHPDRPKVRGVLVVEDLRQILETSNPMYRALFLSMFQGSMGIDEALYWSAYGLDSVRRQLRTGETPLKIDLPGRKKYKFEKPYYTFIGQDGVEALEYWIKNRPDEADDHIFITRDATPINYAAVQSYWMRRCKRLGLITPKREKFARYGKNLHELRDLFRTRWEKSGASGAAAEFFMGHVVDPLEYNKAMRDEGYARREYRKAERWLNILSDDPEKVDVGEVEELRRRGENNKRRITQLERQVEELIKFKRDWEVQTAPYRKWRSLRE